MATVTLTQYKRPNGMKVSTTCEVDQEVADMAKDMALSCEELMNGMVVLYARYADQDADEEELSVGPNGAGPMSPPSRLATLIRKVHARRHA